MPAKTFLAMIREGRRLHAYRLAEQCDIAAIPLCSPRYHKELRGMYLALSARNRSAPPRSVVPVMDAGGEQARRMMFGLFAAAKGVH